MKKQISLSLLGALLCSVAFADTGSIAPGSAVSIGSTANGAALVAPVALGCAVLSSTIKVGTSANVYGGYECRGATAATAAAIGVATCHLSGLKKTKTYTCTAAGQPVAACAAPVAGSPAPTVTIDGGSAYYALSTGGSVAATALGATACDAANAMVNLVTPLVTAGLNPN